MATTTATVAPGKILNRAGQELPRAKYDFAVIGGGLLGIVCAWFLREFADAGKIVLLIEASGIPSEEGATHVAPALHHHFYNHPEELARAGWLSHFLENQNTATPLFSRVGFLRQHRADDPPPRPFAAWRAEQSANVRHNLAALDAGFAEDTSVVFDPAGGYAHAEALALHLGRAAVTRGVDLLLNARAAFDDGDPTTLRLDRLEMNNRMQVEIVRRETVHAATVIVACGASGARFIADQLGASPPAGFGRSYVQYLRFENDADLRRDARGVLAMPVVATARGGFALRPHGDGALLVPVAPPLAPDPADYAPAGGRLQGVPTGLRQELLNRLVAALDAVPALGRASLNLGQTATQLRGAWEALTPSGRPEFRQMPDTAVWLLAGGGEHGFSLGVAKACELAHQLSATTAAPLPWQTTSLSS
ncbi:MAG: FAD-binding oxidoreductase [Verrucomicrobia bacterium]|nr:FAD-binding oxidoreductase [Verrucomicrobiota bacterium]